MSFFHDVGRFHYQLGLPTIADTVEPHSLDAETFEYRVACLNEEIRELTEAYAVQDLARFADALADIVWFALGTAHLAHLPFDAIWEEVRRSNMQKRRWVEGDPVKPRNGTQLEVVKPEGWKEPDVWTALKERITLIRDLEERQCLKEIGK